MKQYFSDLTVFLRTALLIDYKYHYLHPHDREVFNEALNKKQSFKEKEKFIKNILNIMDNYYMVSQWYRHYNPQKTLNDPEFVDNIIEKYA